MSGFSFDPVDLIDESSSIVRVTVTNFMEYESVEFRPEPNLCMILDLEDQEKTVLYTAIAVGLGGEHSLYYQTPISYYVRRGSNQAEIEIEVQAAPNNNNMIFKRTIYCNSEFSDWCINGEPATIEQVVLQLEPLYIQDGNLHQFLPQHRVRQYLNDIEEQVRMAVIMPVEDDSLDEALEYFESRSR
ncbi:2137_t:CDS:2, partial [Paraglomus occultum]